MLCSVQASLDEEVDCVCVFVYIFEVLVNQGVFREGYMSRIHKVQDMLLCDGGSLKKLWHSY